VSFTLSPQISISTVSCGGSGTTTLACTLIARNTGDGDGQITSLRLSYGRTYHNATTTTVSVAAGTNITFYGLFTVSSTLTSGTAVTGSAVLSNGGSVAWSGTVD
jgi:hypothetical protein